MRGDSTLAWLATAMLLATAPFVARAQLDDAGIGPTDPGVDSGSWSFDTGPGASLDTATYLDTGVTSPFGDADPGPRLPGGEPLPQPFLAGDTGGCSCRAAPLAGVMTSVAGSASALALALAAFARRRR